MRRAGGPARGRAADNHGNACLNRIITQGFRLCNHVIITALKSKSPVGYSEYKIVFRADGITLVAVKSLRSLFRVSRPNYGGRAQAYGVTPERRGGFGAEARADRVGVAIKVLFAAAADVEVIDFLRIRVDVYLQPCCSSRPSTRSSVIQVKAAAYDQALLPSCRRPALADVQRQPGGDIGGNLRAVTRALSSHLSVTADNSPALYAGPKLEVRHPLHGLVHGNGG